MEPSDHCSSSVVAVGTAPSGPSSRKRVPVAAALLGSGTAKVAGSPVGRRGGPARPVRRTRIPFSSASAGGTRSMVVWIIRLRHPWRADSWNRSHDAGAEPCRDGHRQSFPGLYGEVVLRI